MFATLALAAAAPGDDVAPLSARTLFSQWQFAPVVTACLLAAAALYLVGVWLVRRDHPRRPWPAWRTVAFLGGLAVIVVATQSSVGVYDDVLFSMHMWQHLLLLMVAPPLLIAGQPVTLLLHASRNPLHGWVKRLVRSQVAAGITFPLVGLALYAATVVGTHLTGFMNLTLTHPVVHDLEHGAYLVAGYLFFLPLVGREPIRWRLSFPAKLFLLLIAMPIDTFTGVVLMQTTHPLFSAYDGRRSWGPSQVSDLHNGGAVMWIGGDAIMLALILGLFATSALLAPRTRGALGNGTPSGQDHPATVSVPAARLQFDAGRWLESARTGRFEELAAAGSAPSSAPGDDPSRGDADTDDAALDAYNAYLARLHATPDPTSGSTPGRVS
jgi:cytochrome c oxidase assembly factor CtaG